MRFLICIAACGILLLLCGCLRTDHPQRSSPILPDNDQPVQLEYDGTDTADFFLDSTHIGQQERDRIEMVQYRSPDSVQVLLKFFNRRAGNFVIRQNLIFKKDGISGLQAKLADFNGDGFQDLTCVSATAARGANEVRRLWIYDPDGDSLRYIQNSMDYPNLLFNERLHCIDAFLVYGGCSTVFLKLNGDSLREFAKVELFDGLTVTTVDRYGKSHLIKRDTAIHAENIRYQNYDPLEVNETY